MNDPLNDPILDALLDEVLGDVEPPNLTERILEAWADRKAAGPSPAGPPFSGALPSRWPLPIAGPAAMGSEPIPPPIQVPGGSGPAIYSSGLRTSGLDSARSATGAEFGPIAASRSPRNGVAGHATGHSRRRSSVASWQTLALAASLLMAVATVGLWVAFTRNDDPRPGVAQPSQGAGGDPLAAAGPALSGRTPGSPGASPRSGPKTSRGHGDEDSPAVPFNRELPFEIAKSGTPGEGPAAGRGGATVDPLPGSDPLPDSEPLPDRQIVAFVNAELQRTWREYDLQPAGAATDEEWCRRVFLRVLGRIPTVEELQRFARDESPARRERLVDRLLSDSEYSEQLAEHWARVWTNVLVGRTRGLGGQGPGNRQGLQDWLRAALLENRPFDQLAGQLIAARGSTDPDDEDFNGAVHYLMVNLDERATLATSRTSQALLGKQLQCAQCHHHPTNDWAQQQFWELNAFFRQMRLERDDREGHYRLVDRDFKGEGGQDAAEAEVYFERLDGKLQAAYPVFLGRQSISPSGRLEDVNRREQLARLVASSDDLSLSVVNRLWAHFLGHGFTSTVDDMGPHSPPSHPQLLNGLASQFAAHDHDLRSLMRWIALSDAFGLSSRVTEGTDADQPDAGGVALFSRYYTRQLPPEEVYQSLELVASARAEGRVPMAAQAKRDWLGQFSRNMGTDDGSETNRFTGDIRQSLIIMNGPLMRQATTPAEGSLLQRVLESKLPMEEKVEHLFLAALARRPTRRESSVIGKMLQSTTEQQTVLQDIWWALLNSNEFILDH